MPLWERVGLGRDAGGCGCPSSEHLKVEPLSVDANENETALPEVAPGLDVMLVSGGDRSTTHVKLAGVASVLPAASVAVTWNVWLAPSGAG